MHASVPALPRPRKRFRRCRALLAVLAAVGALMLFLNRLTPMAADDFFYACRLGLTAEGTLVPVRRLCSLADIAVSQKWVFLSHSGRLPVLGAAQLFTLLPGFAFDLCNTAAFVLLVLLVTALAQPPTPRRAALSALAAFLLLWQYTPAFGQDFLWQTGALNYLWTMDAALLFLLPCLRPELWPRLPQAAALWFSLGLLAGWGMEHQSAAACCLCLARLALQKRKRQPLPRAFAAGTAGVLAGFALLMLAPGSYRRSAGYGQSGLPLALLPQRAAQYAAAVWRQLWQPLALALVLAAGLALACAIGRLPRRLLVPPVWLLAGALACHGAMLLSPTYPLRSMLGVWVFALAALLYGCNRLPGAAALGALCCALGLLFALSVRPAAADLAALRSVTDHRARYLAQQRALGCTDVTVPVASAPATRFSPLWGDALSDLMQDPNNERNRALALYYGVPVVRGDPDLEADSLASTPLSLCASPTARRTKIPAWGLQFQPVSCIIIFTAGP